MTDLWIGLAAWAIASASLLVPALVIAHRCRTRVARLDVLVTAFLWIFLTTLLVLVLGLIGFLRPGPALAASMGLLGIAIACAGRAEVAGILRGSGAVLGGLIGHLHRTLRAHPVLLGEL